MENEINLTDLVNFLSKISGFKGLSKKEMEELIAPIISIAVFEPGQYIIQRGTVGRSVYFLYSGRARVVINEDTHFFVSEGELFGEMSLVTKEKRSADVVSDTQAVCLTIDIETFQTVMANHWQITKAVASLIGDRRVERLATQN
ncbi:MAG: cyclic nucleotide-binding domain-containing protein [Magnetococcales bacterium]|nr:cyclic nucleotide-binding domain-containing protein [Magnetococcales bacterium]